MLAERQSGLAIVGRFSYLHEADLAKSLLESEGIEAWLLDENQIRHRWHLGGALGGVKVAVGPEFAGRALELLARDFSSELVDIPEQGLPAHPTEACPACGASTVHETSTQRAPGPLQWLISLSFLFLGALVPRRRFSVTRACANCSHEWTRRENR